MLIQHVAPGDVCLCGHFCAGPYRGWDWRVLCAAKIHVGGTLQGAESESAEFIRVHGVAIDGYSVEEQLAHSMRLLA